MFAILGDPVLNARDELAFLGSVSGIGFSAKNSLGIWTTASGSSASLHLVARAQGQPLDPSGVKASAFSQIVLQDTGSVVFLATLVNGVGGANSKNNQGIWTEINGQLQSVLRKGDVLAGGTVSALSLFGFPLAPAGVGGQTRNFNRNGGLSFKATFVDGTQSIFVLTSGTELTQVVKTGSSAPPIFGVPSTFLSLGNPILNDRGNTAFQAFVSGTAKGAAKYSAILSESGSGHDLRVIALTGSFAPDANGVKGGNGLFSALGDPVFNCNDQIAFIGKLTTGGGVTAADNQGIWASTSGTLAMVARTQGQAPGCPVGTKFLSFIQLVLPDQGGVVFVANLTGAMGGIKATNNQGIWAVDTAGNLRLVARTGDTLMINGVPKIISSLSLFRTSVGTAGQTRGFNGAGDLIYRATFTDKTQSIQKVVFP